MKPSSPAMVQTAAGAAVFAWPSILGPWKRSFRTSLWDLTANASSRVAPRRKLTRGRMCLRL
eukprot:10047487-Alexandrium_andersonii.AAC.1